MLEILPILQVSLTIDDGGLAYGETYAKTFENSDDGDMTKLSLVVDQEMRCCML